MSTRMVEVRAKVLKQNDLLAHALRERFQREGTCVVGLVSSPGSGKTAFLEKLLGSLRGITVSLPWWEIWPPRMMRRACSARRPT